MLEVSQALEIVLSHAAALPAEACALAPSDLGRTLAVDVRADRDSPPFDKSLRDGYAVRSSDCTAANIELRIVEEIAAGSIPSKSLNAGECSRIFTGAPIPSGADAVVMQEDAKAEPGRVRITLATVPLGQWIFRRGAEMKSGDVVVPAGTPLTPAVFGILANVGCTQVELHPRPRVGILATGDELIEANATPGPGQIRNSNGPMLAAQALRAGATPRNLGIARDDRDTLKRAIREGLESSDVLLLAGGVSVGDYDLVPAMLQECGVAAHFRQVRMKPGKPLLFGTADRTLVFGLPGNPVSSFVAFELFVKPALRRMTGHRDNAPGNVVLPLAAALSVKNDRPTYHPAKVERTGLSLAVRPLPWGGAPDLLSLQPADALLELPAGEVRHQPGVTVSVMLLN